MNGFLIDTNVISELTKPNPNPNVISFLSGARNLWLSTIVLHELDFGINLLPESKRRDRIDSAINAFVEEYNDRIIPVERAEAQQAAALRAMAKKAGRIVMLGDALIAGTAEAHKLCIVTRNISDFEGLGVDLLNPWEAEK